MDSDRFPGWHGTTILGVRKCGEVGVAGDGPLGLFLSDDMAVQFGYDFARGQVGHLRMVSTVRFPLV